MGDLDRMFHESMKSRAQHVPDESGEVLAHVAGRVASRRRARMAGTVAAVAVPVVALGAAANLWLGAGTVAPAVTPSPSLSSSPVTTQESAAETGWSSVPEHERPAWLTDQADGLPDARAMEEWVWQYVDATWTLQVGHGAATAVEPPYPAQSLYLEAPDGELLRVAELPTDRWVGLAEADPAAGLAWLTLADQGDAVEVVQVRLPAVTSEPWGEVGVPASHVHDGLVYGVESTGVTTGLGQIWAGRTYLGEYDSLFVRVEADEFEPLAAQGVLDALVDAGARNGSGDPGVTAWHAADWSYAVFLAQTRDETATPEQWTASTGKGSWVVVDLRTGASRTLEAALPTTFCAPVLTDDATAMAVIDGGSYDEPGRIPAACEGGATPVWLHVEEGRGASSR